MAVAFSDGRNAKTYCWRSQMMAELRETSAAVQPTDTLLVVDAMTGQEAANLVKAFSEQASVR